KEVVTDSGNGFFCLGKKRANYEIIKGSLYFDLAYAVNSESSLVNFSNETALLADLNGLK
ncbi:hypothetical protein, partial [Planococcus sp. 4-30]|uniref:hypothetical protein n=1 Tax=Planococcus sp. 4-30 TaxID=2874583 RepID=UPI001CBE1171